MAETKKEKFVKVKTFLNDLLVYHGGDFKVVADSEVTLDQAINNLFEDEMGIVTEGNNNNG